VILFIGVVYSHPPTTFEILVTQLNGTLSIPNFYGGQVNRIPFIITDLLNGGNTVSANYLVKFHGKFLHVLISSGDTELIYHVHPDDFGSLQNMSREGAYYVDILLPRYGRLYISANFDYQN